MVGMERSILRKNNLVYSGSSFIALTLGVLLFPASLVQAEIKIGGNTQVSLNAAGQAPAGSSGSPVLSANGKIIAFRSDANDLVANDTNSSNDVFIKDLTSGAFSRQSINEAGVQGDSLSTNPSLTSLTPDGFFALAFESEATNLGKLPDTNAVRDIYIRIPSLNITELVSRGVGGVLGSGASTQSSIAYLPESNKLRIVYSSEASNLVPGDTNAANDIFLSELTVPQNTAYDPMTLVVTTKISTAMGGGPANGGSDTPQISGDGAFITYSSIATNLTPGVTSRRQVYRYTIKTGVTELISRTPAGEASNGINSDPVISFSGRYLAYRTSGTNTAIGLDGNFHILRHDTRTGLTVLMDSSSAGIVGNNDALDPGISANGRFVTFSSFATNFFAASDANNSSDIFIKDADTGNLGRQSNDAAGGETNANSDSTFSATVGFNSLTNLTSYRSFATDITAGTASGAGDIYLNAATLDTVNFIKGTRLEVPADSKPGKEKVALEFQKFKGFGTTLRAAAKTTLEYEIQIDKVKGKAKDRKTIISKRNKATVKKLKPGNYTAKYRVKAKKSGKVVTQSPFSPKIQFKVK